MRLLAIRLPSVFHFNLFRGTLYTVMELQFKMWLESNSVPSNFIKNGMVNLYRYSKQPHGDVFLIDPKATVASRNSYSRRDYNASDVPRTFFYLDIADKESLVGSILYVAQIAEDRIYNLIKDPLGLKEKSTINGVLNFDTLLKLTKEQADKGTFDGIYYNPGFPVVNLFVPISAKRTSEEEIRSTTKAA